MFNKHDGDKKYIENLVGNPGGKSELKNFGNVTGALRNKCEK